MRTSKKKKKKKKEHQWLHNRRKAELVSGILWFIFLSSLLLFDLCYDRSFLIQLVFLDMARGVSDIEERENSPLPTSSGLHFRETLWLVWHGNKAHAFWHKIGPVAMRYYVSQILGQKSSAKKGGRRTCCIAILGWLGIAAFTLMSHFGPLFFSMYDSHVDINNLGSIIRNYWVKYVFVQLDLNLCL